MRIRDRSGTGAAHPLTCCDAFSAPSGVGWRPAPRTIFPAGATAKGPRAASVKAGRVPSDLLRRVLGTLTLTHVAQVDRRLWQPAAHPLEASASPCYLGGAPFRPTRPRSGGYEIGEGGRLGCKIDRARKKALLLLPPIRVASQLKRRRLEGVVGRGLQKGRDSRLHFQQIVLR